MHKIIIVIRQTGTAAAFIPVINALKQENLIVMSYYPASVELLKENINFLEISSFNDALPTLNDIDRNCCTLITGTSLYQEDDALWWGWAKENTHESFAFIDQWCNYADRFMKNGKHFSEERMPEKIIVIDEYSKEKLLKERRNLSEHRVLVSPTPTLDRWHSIDINDINQLSNKLRDDKTTILILYVCEPSHKLRQDPTALLDFNFEERLKTLHLAAEKLAQDNNAHVKLLIKPHPIQETRNFKHSLPKSTNQVIYQTVNEDSGKLVLAADIVIGHHSILLYESTHWGKPSFCFLENGEETPDIVKASNKLQKVDHHNLAHFLRIPLKSSKKERPTYGIITKKFIDNINLNDYFTGIQ
ncbi:hypothetical protein IMCC1989_1773 [gamma proteobacterium IMCC1989]|nr:hypothetical protein IMCC1989_1773 [gamma proteobacterium IMCC1989]